MDIRDGAKESVTDKLARRITIVAYGLWVAAGSVWSIVDESWVPLGMMVLIALGLLMLAASLLLIVKMASEV